MLIPLSKPKRGMTKITESQNSKRTYGQTSKQLFTKRWSLGTKIGTTNNMDKHKVKRHRDSDAKIIGNREPQQNYRLGTVSNELLGALKLVLLDKTHDRKV